MALKKVWIHSLFAAVSILVFVSSGARAHDGDAELFRHGSVDDIRAAIEAGADVNARDEEGIPVLTWCAQDNTAQAVALLLAAGADVNAESSRGWTPLMAAASGNPDPGVVSLLVKAGAEVNAKGEEDWDALMYGTWVDASPSVIEALLKAGADVEASTVHGLTALMLAAENSSTGESVALLL